MEKKSIRRQIYFRLDEPLIEKLDRRIHRIGYPSRSDFFEAVAYATLYGAETKNRHVKQPKSGIVQNLPENLSEWLKTVTPDIAEEHIFKELHTIISEMLYPVIAMKGVEVAYENTWEDVRSIFHQKSGIWVTESDLREAYTSFEAIHKYELLEYRENQMRNNQEVQP